ncbi:MAG TPA: thermonuclease family protein [archaeon]|nr:thermonuclease family protein [archaeon]
MRQNILAALILMILFSGCISMPGNENQDADELDPGFASKVIDGDTFELQSGERVRILGINTPERSEYYYAQAKERLSELIEGKEVLLEKDTDELDQNGRLLRHVFVGKANIASKMLEEGFATAYIIDPQMKHAQELEESENFAKKSAIGLWMGASETGACSSSCIFVEGLNYDATGDDCKNPNGEYVNLENRCFSSCDFNGWALKDESASHIYRFKGFELAANSNVTLYSGCSQDSGNELYWCAGTNSCRAVWNNDSDRLFLRNSDGKLVVEYQYSS